MVHIHVHIHQADPVPASAFPQPLLDGCYVNGPVAGAAPEPPQPVGAIGDGTILKLIAEYGPKLLALLIQFGILKLPAGVTFDPNAVPKA
jgi:hypothetical protein